MVLEPVRFVLPTSLPLPPSFPLPQLHPDGFCENTETEVSEGHFEDNGLVHIQHEMCRDEGTYYWWLTGFYYTRDMIHFLNPHMSPTN